MDKKYLISVVIVFVVWMIGSFLVHGIMLGDSYAAMTDVYRSAAEQETLFPFMLIAHVMLAAGLVWIYRRGRENKPWVGQGVRFGILIALFATIPTYLIYYSVQSMSAGMLMTQIVGDGALTILLGLLVAFLYKDESIT